MREHAEKWLKILCGVLVAVLLFQTVRALVRNHPFGQMVLPVPPTLAAAHSEMTAAGPAHSVPFVGPATNPSPTNAPGGTNLAAGLNVTNLPPACSTNHTAKNSIDPTNTIASTETNIPATNKVVMSANGILAGTNRPALTAGRPALVRAPRPAFGAMGGMFSGFGGPGQPGPALPPLVKARVDKIVESELLGPVMHPQPMALLGIAGEVAFLRAASGETGLVKIGDTLGDLKLLKIGINRVLVEQDGQPQELTIFSGMGSDSLLTTSKTISNETTNH